MNFLSSFNAVRYRGINGLSIPQLSRANLVTGENGVGKTALIEAMWLFVNRYNPKCLWNPNVLRTGNRTLDPVSTLADGELELHGIEGGAAHQLKAAFVHHSDAIRPVTLAGTAEVQQLPIVGRIDTYIDGELVEENYPGRQTTIWGTVVHQQPTPPTDRPNCNIETAHSPFQTPDGYLQRYSDLVSEGRKHALTDAIRLMPPGIRDVEILTRAGESYLSGLTTDGHRLPIQDLGGGIVRLGILLLGLFDSRNGLLLMDELENGIHHSKLEQVWRLVRQWMEDSNVQFLATTHSDECIKATMKAFSDSPQDLSIHKLFRNQSGQIEAATFTGESLEGVEDLNLEIR